MQVESSNLMVLYLVLMKAPVRYKELGEEERSVQCYAAGKEAGGREGGQKLRPRQKKVLRASSAQY